MDVVTTNITEHLERREGHDKLSPWLPVEPGSKELCSYRGCAARTGKVAVAVRLVPVSRASKRHHRRIFACEEHVR